MRAFWPTAGKLLSGRLLRDVVPLLKGIYCWSTALNVFSRAVEPSASYENYTDVCAESQPPLSDLTTQVRLLVAGEVAFVRLLSGIGSIIYKRLLSRLWTCAALSRPRRIRSVWTRRIDYFVSPVIQCRSRIMALGRFLRIILVSLRVAPFELLYVDCLETHPLDVSLQCFWMFFEFLSTYLKKYKNIFW